MGLAHWYLLRPLQFNLGSSNPNTCVHIYVYTDVHIDLSLYTHACEYVHIYIYIFICIDVCMYIPSSEHRPFDFGAYAFPITVLGTYLEGFKPRRRSVQVLGLQLLVDDAVASSGLTESYGIPVYNHVLEAHGA